MRTQLMENERGFTLRDAVEGSIGKIIWRLQDQRMIIYGTLIDHSSEGHHNGEILLDAAAEYARAHHYKIKAICPYVERKFQTSTAYEDVQVTD